MVSHYNDIYHYSLHICCKLLMCPVHRLFGPRRKMSNAIARWHSKAHPVGQDLEQAYADKLEAEMQEMAIQLHQVSRGRGVLREPTLSSNHGASHTPRAYTVRRRYNAAGWVQAIELCCNRSADKRHPYYRPATCFMYLLTFCHVYAYNLIK